MSAGEADHLQEFRNFSASPAREIRKFLLAFGRKDEGISERVTKSRNTETHREIIFLWKTERLRRLCMRLCAKGAYPGIVIETKKPPKERRGFRKEFTKWNKYFQLGENVPQNSRGLRRFCTVHFEELDLQIGQCAHAHRQYGSGWCWGSDDNEISKILKLSFRNLTSTFASSTGRTLHPICCSVWKPSWWRTTLCPMRILLLRRGKWKCEFYRGENYQRTINQFFSPYFCRFKGAELIANLMLGWVISVLITQWGKGNGPLDLFLSRSFQFLRFVGHRILYRIRYLLLSHLWRVGQSGDWIDRQLSKANERSNWNRTTQ